MSRMNEFAQPVGEDLIGWETRPMPLTEGLNGQWASVVPLSVTDHSADLWRAFAPADPSLWTYLPFGPFADAESFGSMLDGLAGNESFVPFVVVVDGVALGFACYMRIEPYQGVLEIGSIAFSPAMQATTGATDALYLMINHAFELGYRRCEWKCDDLNGPSLRAAKRLGFQYEGTFRKATHYKGRTRDTAWFALTDDDWVIERPSFEAWLRADNFDQEGKQIRALDGLRSDRRT